MIEVGQWEPCASCYTPTNLFDVEEWCYFCNHHCKMIGVEGKYFDNDSSHGL